MSSLEGLKAELAEIDENFVRNDLSAIEYSEMLLRRKEIYESLHPETRHGGDRKSEKIKCAKCTLETAKSFVNDTAEKLKVDPCTVVYTCHRTNWQSNSISYKQCFQCIWAAINFLWRKRVRRLGLTKETLDQMAAVDVRTVDISTLTDLRDIEIDTSLPVKKKLESFAKQTANVYVHRIGDYVVKVRFQEDGASIDDKMSEYLRRLSEIYI